MYLHADNLSDTADIARAVAGFLRTGDVVVLAGEMGTGKTAFTQAAATALGIDEPVTSPTFNLVHTYRCGALTLHHVDLYRLSRTDEIEDLAIDELARTGAVFVEWGDVGDDLIGDHLEVRIAVGEADDQRDFALRSVGRRWDARWDKLRSALSGFMVDDWGDL